MDVEGRGMGAKPVIVRDGEGDVADVVIEAGQELHGLAFAGIEDGELVFEAAVAGVEVEAVVCVGSQDDVLGIVFTLVGEEEGLTFAWCGVLVTDFDFGLQAVGDTNGGVDGRWDGVEDVHNVP